MNQPTKWSVSGQTAPIPVALICEFVWRIAQNAMDGRQSLRTPIKGVNRFLLPNGHLSNLSRPPFESRMVEHLGVQHKRRGAKLFLRTTFGGAKPLRSLDAKHPPLISAPSSLADRPCVRSIVPPTISWSSSHVPQSAQEMLRRHFSEPAVPPCFLRRNRERAAKLLGSPLPRPRGNPHAP